MKCDFCVINLKNIPTRIFPYIFQYVKFSIGSPVCLPNPQCIASHTKAQILSKNKIKPFTPTAIQIMYELYSEPFKLRKPHSWSIVFNAITGSLF